MADKNDRHEFTEVEWKALAPLIGDISQIQIVYTKSGAINFAELVKDNIIDARAATERDIRIYLQDSLSRAKEMEGYKVWPIKFDRAAQRASEIFKQSSRLLALLEEEARESPSFRPRLAPKDPRELALNIEWMNLLKEGVAHYQPLGSEYRRKAELNREVHKDFSIGCRNTYWSDLLELWTKVLKKPPTSSPTGPLTRFITFASAPMESVLRPSADTIHRFASAKFRSMQNAESSPEDLHKHLGNREPAN